MYEDEFEAANKINEIFGSFFGKKFVSCMPPMSAASMATSWCPLANVEDIWMLLQNLNTKKSAGSDAISPLFYRLSCDLLAEPLTHLVNSSILECRVPRVFKHADVCAVPKCNPPAIDKLRPISLLCIPNKILETVVINSLKDQMIADLPDYQFAYKKHSSSTTALIDMHNKVTHSLEKSEVAGVIIISFDFAKAFDKIPHIKLIDRLISLDYPENFILWIASYLQNRSQCVKINQTRSDSIEISGGVPQGSVLGPFLFMLYLSSYKPYYNSSYPVIFADDTYIIIEI